MTRMAGEINDGGWRIATGFAATSLHNSHNFYAVYAGDAFGHPERGVIAIMARAHAESPEQATGARYAAQIVVHSLAEGYFGARRTLSTRRAASLSLTAVNRWLFDQVRTDAAGHLTPVSLTAVLFHNDRIGLVQIGTCQGYRCRNGILSPLMREHTHVKPEGRKAPTRAIGLDLDLAIDFIEETAEPADRYILVSGMESQNPDSLCTGLTEPLSTAPSDPTAFAQALLVALNNAPGDDKAIMVLDIIAVPPGRAATPAADLADLPLRPAPREGDVWDGFILGKTLYHGRYTMLKAAYDSIEKREVVLKIPLPAMLQDEIFTAGFMREAWIGTIVRGATVARYLELPPERRSSLYLVMPLYNGETLENRLHRGPAVSLPEGIGIALKLCEAVQDLAAIQIVHRDIKPENIMLLADNELRLLDLGLAYLPGIDTMDRARPGGTIRYMAPELLQGVAANARTEVYALAVTIYRMFAGGAYPFGQREVTPLARLRPDLPRWLGHCLARALAAQPAERFKDSGEFARALQIALTTAPEDDAKSPKQFPLSRLQIWQVLTVIFALGFLIMLLLRGLK
ncbi:MAG: protein kinase [Acidiphilium sp.]|nr:protein kinase [Acidiphilium sp.]MDD4936197.1 protein kinase [Acidiphilium sp.]